MADADVRPAPGSSASDSPPHAIAPGPIAPTDTMQFAGRDGVQLHGEWYAAPEQRGGALIVHGYHEHCGRYREVAHALVQAGISALTFDLRGHGRSEGQRGHIDGIREYLDDTHAALDALEDCASVHVAAGGRTDAVPLALVGHSNGGLVVLRLLSDPFLAPSRIVCAAVSSPFLELALEVPRGQKLVGQIASRLMPRLSLPNKLEVDKLTSDPIKQEERRLDTLCHDVASARWYTETVAAQRYVLEFADRIQVPTLWLVADGDRVVAPAASRQAYARLRAPAQFHGFDGFEHEVFNERERGVPLGLLTRYLADHLVNSSR